MPGSCLIIHRARWISPYSFCERETEDRSVPPKVRELIADLQRAGFVDRGGKGSHRNFVHPKATKPVVMTDNLGDDAKRYQVRAVQLAIEESKK